MLGFCEDVCTSALLMVECHQLGVGMCRPVRKALSSCAMLQCCCTICVKIHVTMAAIPGHHHVLGL
jgi:hypothetical protein